MWKQIIKSIATAVAVLALSGVASAQNGGDPAKGLELAEEVCAACHGIGNDYEPSPEPFAPSFEAIANTPGMTGLALAVFLQTPHATMPNLVLSGDEIANVSAYILSLKE